MQRPMNASFAPPFRWCVSSAWGPGLFAMKVSRGIGCGEVVGLGLGLLPGWGHIRWLGDGRYGFRPYGGSLWKSPKVTKGLLPHHSAPRSGSVCPNEGLNPWAAVTGHPWPNTANPASCRVTHGFKPAFGQRGLTGRLRSRSTARRPSSRPEWLDHKRTRGGLTAGLILKAELNQMWELACLRWHQLVVPDRPRCLHRRQASSHRKAKAVRCWRSVLGQTVGAGLLAKAFGQ